MKKKMNVVVLTLCMFAMSAGFVFADTVADNLTMDKTPQGAEAVEQADDARMLPVHSVGFKRVKALQGTATLSATASTTVDYIKVEVTIQKLNKDTGVYYDYDSPFTYIEYNTISLTEIPTYTVGSSGTYRIKAIFSDKQGSRVTTYSATYSSAVGL